MAKLKFTTKKVRFIARCTKGDYHSPAWRETENEAAQDAIRHKSQPGKKNHKVEIFEEHTKSSII